MRQSSREATTPRQRERLLVQAERLAAKGQVQQIRLRDRQRRQVAHQCTWQKKLAERQSKREKGIQVLQEMEDRLFYDFDLEKDNLTTYQLANGIVGGCMTSYREPQPVLFCDNTLRKLLPL